MRKTITFILILALILSLSTTAYAADSTQNNSLIPPIDEISPNKDLAQGSIHIIQPAAATGGILEASNQLRNAGNGILLCSSNTRTNGQADQISVSYQVQRYTGTDWTFVGDGSTTGYKTSNYSGSISKSVSLGYYYRLVTYHYSYIGGNLVSSCSVTSTSIYVG